MVLQQFHLVYLVKFNQFKSNSELCYGAWVLLHNQMSSSYLPIVESRNCNELFALQLPIPEPVNPGFYCHANSSTAIFSTITHQFIYSGTDFQELSRSIACLQDPNSGGMLTLRHHCGAS